MFRVRTVFTGVPGTPWINNLYFTEDETAQAAADRVQAFWAAFTTSISTAITGTVEPDVAVMNEESGVVTDFITTDTDPVDFGLASDPLPWQTQCLVRFNTGVVRNGRRVIGHMFIPGLTEDSNTNGVPNAAFTALVATRVDTLLLSPGAGEAQLGVWSRPGVGVGLGQLSLVAGASVDAQWSYLRSRRD